MFPKEFPYFNNGKRRAISEKKVFDALSNLPNSYWVFYNITWQTIKEKSAPKEGEADFIIAHPEKGIMILEVKGGQIVFDPQVGCWTSKDYYGNQHIIKNPIEQSTETKHWLIAELKKIKQFKPNWIKIWHAVCFPDTLVQEKQFIAPDLDRRQVFDYNDLNSIVTNIEQFFKTFVQTQSGHNLGNDGILILENLLASDVKLPSPLQVQLKDEERVLINLTESQFNIFSYLGKRTRAAISGCAGSGKTMLAKMRAEQLASLGYDVLFLCYNRKLFEFLSPILKDCKVSTFHGLCEEAIKKTNKDLRGVPNIHKFENVYPDALIEYANLFNIKYDAIIVDEAQDFQENYWIATEALLKPDSYLYIFFDDNQNLFEGDITFQGLIDEDPFTLIENCRNTKSIHNHVKAFHSNPILVARNAPQGRTPKWTSYCLDSELRIGLRKELNRLHNIGNVPLENIVILTPKSEKNSILKEGVKLGNYVLSWYKKEGTVFVSTIQSFKGLERLVVIIAEIDKEVPRIENLLYTGCSRAVGELTCFYNEGLEHLIIEKGLT